MSKELVKKLRAHASLYGEGYTPNLLTQAADLIESLATWRDIESAPRDGTSVLCAWIVNGRHTAQPEVLSYFPDWHGKGKGAWVLSGDFSVKFDPDGVHNDPPEECANPTHYIDFLSFMENLDVATAKVSHCTACGKEIPYTEHIDNRQCLKHLQIYT